MFLKASKRFRYFFDVQKVEFSLVKELMIGLLQEIRFHFFYVDVIDVMKAKRH